MVDKILSFRPGVADDATAFEAMTNIYKYLENEFNYDFTILTYPSDDFKDDQLDIVPISQSEIRLNLWKGGQFISSMKPGWLLSSRVKSYFTEADGVLTLDPTTHILGDLAIRYSINSNIPVWFDAGRTTARPWLGLKWKLRQLQFQNYLRDVAGIIVTSPKVIERFREIGLYDERISSKFTVMGHPVDVDTFNPERDGGVEETNIRITTMGRLVPEKGIYYILDALTPILEDRKNVSWTIIGAGPMKSLIEREVAEREIENYVEFTGIVPHNEVPYILNSSDIFVSHSVDISRWEEFFGVANVEAMACELACIVTNSGSIPYVIRKKDIAKVVPQRDVVAIRKETEKLIASSENRREMGMKARDFVKRNYSVESISQKYHEMLQRGVE